jgi:hypothetical protein
MLEALEDRSLPAVLLDLTPPVIGADGPAQAAPAAEQHGAHVIPIKISGAGELKLDLATLTGTFTASGQATHLGNWTSEGDFELVPIGGTTFTVSASVTYTAANGDTLKASIFGTVDLGTGLATLTYTFNGGTDADTGLPGGRFEGAAGTATETAFIQDLATGLYTLEVDGSLELPGK